MIPISILSLILAIEVPIPSSLSGQTIQQTPHVQVCQLPCTIPLQPELALHTPHTKPNIHLQATDCEFGTLNMQTRSAQCTSTITVQTNAGFRLLWSLAPVSHRSNPSYRLVTEYRIEPTNGDPPVIAHLDPDSQPRILSTPVWLPGVHGPVATYRLTATASLPPHAPVSRAGQYDTHINVTIDPVKPSN
jgi:hypothetical protein